MALAVALLLVCSCGSRPAAEWQGPLVREDALKFKAPDSGNLLDGPRLQAQFWGPGGLAFDREQNLYVADCHGHTIRKIDSRGIVSSFAGAPKLYPDGVLPEEAKFSCPTGLVFDGKGNLYVSDPSDANIRRIDPQGMVTSFAGWPASFSAGWADRKGMVDGKGQDAHFEMPAGMAIDHSGNIYVVDRGNNNIRKINPDGVVTTLAGTDGAGFILTQSRDSADGSGHFARFNDPVGIAIDDAGYLYVTEAGNADIQRISPDGHVRLFAGAPGKKGDVDGPVAEARFKCPSGIAIDHSGNIYIADPCAEAVRKISHHWFSGTVISTVVRGPIRVLISGQTYVLHAWFNPQGIAIDSSGTVYIADGGAGNVSKITPEGSLDLYAGENYMPPEPPPHYGIPLPPP